jgi:hypothetical protein
MVPLFWTRAMFGRRIPETQSTLQFETAIDSSTRRIIPPRVYFAYADHYG